MSNKHTIDQLEQLIDEEEDAISILPNGTIVVQAKLLVKQRSSQRT